MRSRGRFLIVVLIAGMLVSLSGAAIADRGGNGKGQGGPNRGSSSLSLVLLDSTDGVAHWGQNVTFGVSTTATDKPLVEAACSQGGNVVYRHSAGFYPGYPWPEAQVFNLSSAAWTGGAADCTATLYMSNRKGGFITLTTIGFHVEA